MEFSNILELKKRLMPALKIRVKELRKIGYNYNEDTLFLMFGKMWKNFHDLTLSDLVDDILNRKIENINTVGDKQ